MHRNPHQKSSKIQNKHKKNHRKSKQETVFCLNLVALVFDLSYTHLSRVQRLRFSDAHYEFLHISIYPFSREFDVCDSVMPILCVCLCVCVCVCFYIVQSPIRLRFLFFRFSNAQFELFIYFIYPYYQDFNVCDTVMRNLSFCYQVNKPCSRFSTLTLFSTFTFFSTLTFLFPTLPFQNAPFLV
jgi:hypothetical protein